MTSAPLWMAIALVCVSGVARADEPPSWSPFDVLSSNGRYLAAIRLRDEREPTEPTVGRYQLTVFDTQGRAPRPVWSCAYAYDGYPGGFLSDDGATFVYVNTWYAEDAPVVSIYHQGRPAAAVPGRDFHILAARIRPTDSHRVWLDESGPPSVRFVQLGTLAITTIDRKIHLLDLASGTVQAPAE